MQSSEPGTTATKSFRIILTQPPRVPSGLPPAVLDLQAAVERRPLPHTHTLRGQSECSVNTDTEVWRGPAPPVVTDEEENIWKSVLHTGPGASRPVGLQV